MKSIAECEWLHAGKGRAAAYSSGLTEDLVPLQDYAAGSNGPTDQSQG